MYGLQEHEMRFYCLFKKVYFSLLATSDFFCRHAYAYAHMRIIRHESDMAAYAWPSLVKMQKNVKGVFFTDKMGVIIFVDECYDICFLDICEKHPLVGKIASKV